MFQKVSNEDTSERSFKEDEVDYYETNIKNENCTDSHHMFQVGIKEFTCNWAVHNKVNQCKKNAVAKNCPMTCGLCKPLKPYPNMPPSMSPEMPPTAVLHPNNTMSWHDDVSHEDENCTDRHSNFHVGTKEFKCNWAAHNKVNQCKKNAVAKNCPMTCGLCKPLKPYPNMPPSMSPEMPPTAVLHPNNTMSWHDDVSHEDENCTDRHSNFHVGTKEFTCKWAAQNKAKRCKKNAVSKNCPITCDLCKPEMFYYDV